MRYYCLTIVDPATGLVWKPTPNGNGFTKSAGGVTFASTSDGTTSGTFIPGALNIEFDIPVYRFAQPQGNAWIRVWGVGLGMIGQAANLNGANFTLSAGMSGSRKAGGLQLGNPAQAGLIIQGQIFQAFGNWQGQNQTLELICYPGAAGIEKNIPFSWMLGTSLKAAIASSLTFAFPAYKQNINIADDLTSPGDQYGHYESLAQFADAIQRISYPLGAGIYGIGYSGVQISVTGNTIRVSDGQGDAAPKLTQLEFQDLIGQPTWIESAQVDFSVVMRADIAVEDQVKFPQGIQAPYALTSIGAAAPNAPVSSKTAFQGKFTVVEVHQFANYRQPDANSWVTTIRAAANLAA